MFGEGERVMEYLLGRKCHRRSCDREGDDRGVRETVISENYSAKKVDMVDVC